MLRVGKSLLKTPFRFLGSPFKRVYGNRSFSKQQLKYEPALQLKDSLDSESVCGSSPKILNADKLYLHFAGHGSEPVVMLHDLASTNVFWHGLVSKLNQNQFRFIAPDLLGHGRSPTGPLLAHDLQTHLHYLKRDVFDGWAHQPPAKIVVKPVHLIGHGLGAILALELAAALPHLVKNLTLIDLPCYQSDEQAHKYQQWTGHVCYTSKFSCQLSTLFFCYTFFLWGAIIPLVSYKPTKLVLDSMCHTTPVTYRTYQKVLVSHRIDNVVERLRTPTTIIHGKSNSRVPCSFIQNFAQRHPEISQLILFENAGHNLPLTHTTQLAHFLTKEVLIP